jgi:hypothetical protein
MQDQFSLCECGCGTPVFGFHHGTPVRFVRGHRCRMPKYKHPVDERYYAKLLCGLTPDDCYDWLGSRHKFGYGHLITSDGKTLSAHRGRMGTGVRPDSERTMGAAQVRQPTLLKPASPVPRNNPR